VDVTATVAITFAAEAEECVHCCDDGKNDASSRIQGKDCRVVARCVALTLLSTFAVESQVVRYIIFRDDFPVREQPKIGILLRGENGPAACSVEAMIS
jgi:hypothetical protein